MVRLIRASLSLEAHHSKTYNFYHVERDVDQLEVVCIVYGWHKPPSTPLIIYESGAASQPGFTNARPN